MLKTRPAKEIIVRMANEIGAFDRMMKIVADKGINILAVSAWVEGDQAVIHLVTDNDTLEVDAAVEVRSRFHDRWIGGFTIAEAVNTPSRR